MSLSQIQSELGAAACNENDSRGHYVICKHHMFSHKTHYVNVKQGNKSWSQQCKIKITLPENIGHKSSVNKLERSCGLGSDRELKRVWEESHKIIERGLIAECDVDEEKKMQIKKSPVCDHNH